MNRAPRFTRAALECIEATSADWRADLAALNTGATTEAALLAHCLDGAEDPAVARGWHEYVSELCSCTDDPPSTEPDSERTQRADHLMEMAKDRRVRGEP